MFHILLSVIYLKMAYSEDDTSGKQIENVKSCMNCKKCARMTELSLRFLDSYLDFIRLF